MRRCFFLMLPFSAVLWAQQDSPKSSPAPSNAPSSSPSTNREPSAAERNPFPEDDSPANVEAPKAHAATMAPPRSDSVQIDDLGLSAGESSSKDTQVDLSPPDNDAKAHPQSSTAV